MPTSHPSSHAEGHGLFAPLNGYISFIQPCIRLNLMYTFDPAHVDLFIYIFVDRSERNNTMPVLSSPFISTPWGNPITFCVWHQCVPSQKWSCWTSSLKHWPTFPRAISIGKSIFSLYLRIFKMPSRYTWSLLKQPAMQKDQLFLGRSMISIQDTR